MQAAWIKRFEFTVKCISYRMLCIFTDTNNNHIESIQLAIYIAVHLANLAKFNESECNAGHLF